MPDETVTPAAITRLVEGATEAVAAVEPDDLPDDLRALICDVLRDAAELARAYARPVLARDADSLRARLEGREEDA